MFFEDQQKGDRRHYSADPVGQRLGVESASGSEEYWQDDGKQHVVSFPEYREEQCGLASSKGGKAVYKHILETEGNDHHGKYPDTPYAEIELSGISGENADEIFRNRSGYQEHNCGKAQAEKKDVFLCRLNSVNIFGTIVVA